MASSWSTTPIGEVARVRSGYAFKSSDWKDHGTPVVKIANVKEGRLEMGGASRVEGVVASQAREFELADGDVLIAMTGYVGDTARVIKPDLPLLLNQRVGKFFIRDRAKLDGRFLFYVLRLPSIRDEIKSRGYGSAQPNVSPSLIESVEIPLPPIEEQRRIVHILGTLDDKIELNRRMNETLEEMARALFKSWFVDFDPVRAKAEGRDSGLPKHLADLFPDRLVDSELGEIPGGWLVAPFSKTVSVASGGTPKTSKPDYWSGDIPWFSVVDAPSPSDVWVTRTQKTVSQTGIDSCAASVMPKGTTILSARGTVGKVALAGRATAFNQSCYGFPVQPGELGYFTYFATLNIVDSLQRRAHGSVFSTITRATLDGLAVTSIPPQCRAAFEAVTAPLLERILTANLEAEALAHSRDALLTVLLASGEHGEHERGVHA